MSPDNRVHPFGDVAEFEHVRLRRRRKGVAGYLRAQLLKPEAKPASLKAGMSRYKYSSSTPEFWFHLFFSR